MKKNNIGFSFNEENILQAKNILAKYPKNRQKSATLPLLQLAQKQNNGWLSTEAMEYVANFISVPFMLIYEVASFYTMFNLKPVGKYHIQVCGTTPCWLRGAHDIMKSFEEDAKTKQGETSDDDLFTISQVECLGACRNAPVAQINDDFYEDLDSKKVRAIITSLKKTNNS